MWKAPRYRKSYKKRYGSRCFLDPKRNAYPVCTNGKIDPKGLNAAAYYLRFHPNRKLTRKLNQYRDNIKTPR
jgi:hypothetical protein